MPAVVIHAQHHGPQWRGHVQAKDVTDLVHERQIGRQFEGLLPMKLQTAGALNAQDRALRKIHLTSHAARAGRPYPDRIYAPDLNPVEYLWAWLKCHALANYCPSGLAELHCTARNKLKSAWKRPLIIAACWMQATLW